MSTSKAQSREPLNIRQRSILIAFYDKNPYPSATERQQLVQLTGRTSKQIQDWFSNRRRNDPKLVPGKTTSVSLSTPSPSVPMQPMYYYTPVAPPPISTTICPCCYLTQSSSIIDQSLYSPCSTFYYPPSNNTFHS
ncbi:unnamed protein product [Rotaria sp. Silwood2]|nr:unnamed protein product [Rotaria sp. Silwood2]CAF2666625.1 unnamed protein product [Rotaria sp. Silwood2]CAF2934927.1 unnamed protein product [Rotaria sp. Silwood2]CAF3085377.1 unnamed protein product [Rotaria sp. Silwood2]CAF3990659.1 unnamed protein product [Rotaria sp. Silwood2]